MGADLDAALAALAAHRDPSAVRAGAAEFPSRFGPAAVPELAARFRHAGEPPPHVTARTPSATAWLACWQAALLEVLFHYRDHALPALRELALTGAPAAAVVLCRLAADGVERDRIVADLADLPYPVRDAAAALLASEVRANPAVADFVAELERVPVFARALAGARRLADEDGGAPAGKPAAPVRVGGNRVVRGVIAAGAGIGAGAAVANATGVWGALAVGGLAAVLAAAVVALAERAVFGRPS